MGGLVPSCSAVYLEGRGGEKGEEGSAYLVVLRRGGERRGLKEVRDRRLFRVS